MDEERELALENMRMKRQQKNNLAALAMQLECKQRKYEVLISRLESIEDPETKLYFAQANIHRRSFGQESYLFERLFQTMHNESPACSRSSFPSISNVPIPLGHWLGQSPKQKGQNGQEKSEINALLEANSLATNIPDSLFQNYVGPDAMNVICPSDSDSDTVSSDDSHDWNWEGSIPFASYCPVPTAPSSIAVETVPLLEPAGGRTSPEIIDLVEGYDTSKCVSVNTIPTQMELASGMMSTGSTTLLTRVKEDDEILIVEIGDRSPEISNESKAIGALVDYPDAKKAESCLKSLIGAKTNSKDNFSQMDAVNHKRKMAVVAPFYPTVDQHVADEGSKRQKIMLESFLSNSSAFDPDVNTAPDVTVSSTEHPSDFGFSSVERNKPQKMLSQSKWKSGTLGLEKKKEAHMKEVVKKLKLNASRISNQKKLSLISPQRIQKRRNSDREKEVLFQEEKLGYSEKEALSVEKKLGDREKEAVSLEEKLASTLFNKDHSHLKSASNSSGPKKSISKETGSLLNSKFKTVHEFSIKEQKMKVQGASSSCSSSSLPAFSGVKGLASEEQHLKASFGGAKGDKESSVSSHKPFNVKTSFKKKIPTKVDEMSARIHSVSPLTRLLPRSGGNSDEIHSYRPPLVPNRTKSFPGYLSSSAAEVVPVLAEFHEEFQPLLLSRVSKTGSKKKNVTFAQNLEQIREISPLPWKKIEPNITRSATKFIIDDLLPASFTASAPVEATVKEKFLTTILKWHPAWIMEYQKAALSGAKMGKLVKFPNILGEASNSNSLSELPQRFSSSNGYEAAFLPLLICEVFEQIAQDFSNSNDLNFTVKKSEAQSGRFRLMEIHGIIPKTCAVDWENSLVRINPNSNLLKVWLGLFEKCQYQYCSNFADCPDQLKEDWSKLNVSKDAETNNRSLKILTAEVKVLNECFADTTSVGSTSVGIQHITSLTSTLRIVDGISGALGTQLGHLLLDPAANLTGFSVNNVLGQMLFSEMYNEDRATQVTLNAAQKDVILSHASDIVNSPQEPRIGLIHGPPGSGKSQTIIGLTEEIKRRRKHLGIPGTVLLVGASNGAVDELSRKLIKRNKLLKGDPGTNRMFNFIRAGNPKQIADDIKEYSLDYLVKVNAASASIKYQQHMNNELVSKAKARINMLTTAKQKILEDGTIERAAEQISSINLQITTEQQAINGLPKSNPAPSAKEIFEIRRSLVLHADIVATTLNSCGSSALDFLYQAGVLCVIVDEACQATELETLIPLRFNPSKLILVGDPLQLPPTVLSKTVARQRFSVSLFQRCMDCMTLEQQQGAIKFLNVQYRMAEPIASFPSSFIYQGKLLTDSSVGKSFPYDLSPYQLFNICYGEEEQNSKGSYQNAEETEFVLELCLHVLQHGGEHIKPSEIGVISFYRDQVERLRSIFQKTKLKIEVNTVDGFQGREKQVIVLSCVRSSQRKHQIGFLADKRRMTVAITRAKSGLYIVANTKTLQRSNEYWSALINDAQSRKLVHDVSSRTEFSKAFAILKENVNQ